MANDKFLLKGYDMIEEMKARRPLFRWALLLALVAAFIYINWPFLMAMVLASIFALGTFDALKSLHIRTGLSFKSCVLIGLIGGFIIFWVPITLAIYRIVANISRPESFASEKIVGQIHTLKDFLLEYLRKVSEFTGMDLAAPAKTFFENSLRGAGEILLNFSSQFLSQLPAIFINTFIFILLLGLLLIKSETVKEKFLQLSPYSDKNTVKFIDVCKKSCSVTLFSTFVIGLIQAGVIGLGSLVTGEGDFWLVLTVTFFVSFIPVIGAAPVGYLLAILAFIGGRSGSGFILVVIATIAGSIDNVIKPFMVGRENNVNPIIGFTCVVGAIVMMGLPGLLIGPVIMNLFVGIAPLLLNKDEDQILE